MFFQRILAWAALAAGAAAAGHEVVAGRLFTQPVWTPEGLASMAAFVGGYVLLAGLLIWFAPRWLAPALGLVVAGYSIASAGPWAVAAVVLVLGAAYVTGGYLMRRRSLGGMPVAATVLGLAVWIGAMAVTARFPIHHWTVYLGLIFLVFAGAWSRQALQRPAVAWPADRGGALSLAIPALPFLMHWLAALKPEVDAQALGVHLMVPARVAAHYVWPFNVQEFAWAVKPMGGEWAFTLAYVLGAEGGARLLNVALLGLLCWLLFAWLHDLLPGRLAALLTALFASTPLVHRMTGALRVENVAALMLLAAVYYYRHYLKSRTEGYAYAAALLAGVTALVSMSSFAFVTAFVAAALMTARWRTLLKCAPLALSAGLLPGVEAWWRTGNPVFPYFNTWFRSPLFDAVKPLVEGAGLERLGPAQWWGVVFESSRFVDGMNGSLGIALFVAAPLCVVAMRANWPRIGWVLLGMWVAGFAMLGLFGTRAEALYAGLPVLTLSVGVMAATFRQHSRALPAALTVMFAAGIASQLYLLPAAAPEHRGFASNPAPRLGSADEYVARWAPEKPLVGELNRVAPGSRVVWLESNSAAGFAGPVLSNTWHHQAFDQRMEEATSAEGLLFTMTETEVDYFVAPAPESPRPLKNLFMREFLELYTTVESRSADWELRRFISPETGQPPLRAAFAQAGEHDEASPYARFEGPWKRSLEFGEAMNGTLAFTNDVRARAFIRFEGRAITPVFTAAPNRCQVLVTLDDDAPIEWRQYAPVTAWQARGPRIEAAPGRHTLQIRLPQSGDISTVVNPCYVDLDGFSVE
jgi:hypothetical protein